MKMRCKDYGIDFDLFIVGGKTGIIYIELEELGYGPMGSEEQWLQIAQIIIQEYDLSKVEINYKWQDKITGYVEKCSVATITA